MGATKHIQFEKQDIVKCDERGRANLGTEYADEQVIVWVAPTPDLDDMQPMSPEEEKEAMQIMQWAEENDIDWFDIDPYTGVVEDENGETVESPFGLKHYDD